MDQTACSVGGLIHIDFADPDNTYVKKLDVDFEAYDHCLCITDTKGSHADLTDEYASIPADMKKAAAYFGKEVLRQVDEKEFFGKLAELREKLGGPSGASRPPFLWRREESGRGDRRIGAGRFRCI